MIPTLAPHGAGRSVGNAIVLAAAACLAACGGGGNPDARGKDGGLAWSHRVRGARVRVHDAAVGGDGHAILVGHFHDGRLEIGGATLVSEPRAGETHGHGFVVALDANGRAVWARRFEGNQETNAAAVVADARGHITVLGLFTNEVDFGEGHMLARDGVEPGGEVFLVQLDPTGRVVWAKGLGERTRGASGLAVDRDGNIIVSTPLAADTDLGGGPLAWKESYQDSHVVAKLDRDGRHVWSRRLGYVTELAIPGVATDAAGDVVIGGWCRGDLDLGGGVLVTGDLGPVGFVAKLNAAGRALWSRRTTTTKGGAGDTVLDVAVDPAGNVFAAGSLTLGGVLDAPVRADRRAWVLPNEEDGFMVKLDPSGRSLWGETFRGQWRLAGTRSSATALATDAAGAVFVGGYFEGLLDFGSGRLRSEHGRVFVTKRDAEGRPQWSRTVGDLPEVLAVRGLSVDARGAAVVAATSFGSNYPRKITVGPAPSYTTWLTRPSGEDGEALYLTKVEP